MAEQHVRALQRKRGQFDPLDYAIMEVVALDVGRNGEPARTSLRTIAERAGCHYNTVSSRLDDLAERGMVSIERKGKYSYYRVHVGIEQQERRQSAPAMPDEPATDPTSERLDRIEERLSQIVVTMERLSQTLSQIVTMAGENDVTEEGEDIPPPTPPTKPEQPSTTGSGGGGDKKPAIEELAEYFCQITGRKMPRKYRSDYARRFWWEPLAEIYNQHGDYRETRRAMYGAVQYADEAGLTIATPKSLINLAVAGAKDHSGYRNSDGTLVVTGR